MPQARTSITIKGDLDKIFEMTNDIGRWHELYNEYHKTKVLSLHRDGRFAKIEFEITDENNYTWRSWRILDYKEHIAVAQRGEPKFPYIYMHLTWLYEPTDDGVVMTWIHDVEMDPKAPYSNEQVVPHMIEHMQANQRSFKRVIESMLGTATPAN